MFEVQEKTAREIFYAQDRRLQGRLRLDISSRSFPADPNQPFDVLNARVAIGLRVVQLVTGCANEATQIKDRTGFVLDAIPPAPDAADRLLLMPNAGEFEAFMRFRLNRLFGLDLTSRHYACALHNLATDFHSWCQTPEAQNDLKIQTDGEKVFIVCKRSHQPELSALKPADSVWRESRK